MSGTLRLLSNESAADPAAPGEPAHVGALILRVLDGGGEDAAFLARRAVRGVEALPRGPERRHLVEVLRGLAPGAGGTNRVPALVAWAGHLESRELLEWAARVLECARALRPDDPELVLHAARVARKSGDRDGARHLYDRVADLDRGSGALARVAAVGHGLLADEPRGALARAMRESVRAGHHEAAAVAQEARARLRRADGDLDGAVRDFAAAAVRYGHPADAGRIGHEVADLLGSAGEPLAARRVLLAVERLAHPHQVARARARLLSLSRVLGDEVGLRRWADASAPSLVSLTPRLGPGKGGSSRARRVDRCIARLSSLASGGGPYAGPHSASPFRHGPPPALPQPR